MKFQTLSCSIVLAAASLMLSACYPLHHLSFNKALNPVNAAKDAKASLADGASISYPGALVIEGGEGTAIFDNDGKTHKPLWRVTLCLPDTDAKEATAEYTLDLDKLGTPFETTIESQPLNDAHAVATPLYKQIIHSVKMSYRYSTQLKVSSPELETSGYATVYLKSDATIEETRIAPGDTLTPAPSHDDWTAAHSFFNPYEQDGKILGRSEVTFSHLDKNYYFFMYLDESYRIPTVSPSLHRMEVCEKEQKSVVVQTGEELNN